jgi:nucleotide-binding universal stress UspA family protein
MNHTSAGSSEPPSIVLVGMDGSTGSERAFRVGLKIAKRRGLALRLVGTFLRPVMTDSSYVPLMNQYLDTVVNEIQEMLRGYASHAEEAGVRTTTRALVGDPGGTLVDESKSARVAVVGKRGRNRFAGRFLGSVSAHLAAHAHCPTLVVPEEWESDTSTEPRAPAQQLAHGDDAADEPLSLIEESKPRAHKRRVFANVSEQVNFDSEVVVGVDLGTKADEMLRVAGEAAHLVNRPLALVSASPLNADGHWGPNPVEHNIEIPNLRRPYIEHLQDSAHHMSEQFPELTVRWQFFDGTPAGVLSEASRTAELIIIGTRGHGGFPGLLLGSVSQAVLNRAVCPVLVVPTAKN